MPKGRTPAATKGKTRKTAAAKAAPSEEFSDSQPSDSGLTLAKAPPKAARVCFVLPCVTQPLLLMDLASKRSARGFGLHDSSGCTVSGHLGPHMTAVRAVSADILVLQDDVFLSPSCLLLWIQARKSGTKATSAQKKAATLRAQRAEKRAASAGKVSINAEVPVAFCLWNILLACCLTSVSLWLLINSLSDPKLACAFRAYKRVADLIPNCVHAQRTN